MHVLTHLILLWYLPPMYPIHYLLLSFFSAPLMIWLAKQTRVFDVVFAFVPLLIGSSVYALL
ncbi:hypothetical protein [Vibrio sp. CAU 1672]|uniref:hypothetical protein n=1 Tax=Vibrio sp. CAU 1672 TaxID=3032594 RepID=UPI0023DBFF4E|nr:hypothetical protein [Vibrio sp. CAU 1672]MDF2155404.1 hypothetical protein [Vibrio sp. CAU 1672]